MLSAGVAGLGHYKNRAEKLRPVDSSGGGSSSAVLNAARLEGQAVYKAERLQGLSTPHLVPYDKNYSRKRLREHSLDRTDSESLTDELSNTIISVALINLSRAVPNDFFTS